MNEYYEGIDACKTSLKKISVIANLCQRLDQVHPFYDGNIRVFAILLLDYLCLENGFKIPTLLDPNVFDMLSNTELIDKIIGGFERTRQVLSSELSCVRTVGSGENIEQVPILRAPERNRVHQTQTPDRRICRKNQDRALVYATPSRSGRGVVSRDFCKLEVDDGDTPDEFLSFPPRIFRSTVLFQ